MDEAGFTLIELLIATMITAIILTVLTASFLIFLQNASYTSGRDDHAAGAEALSAWLDRDLASATTLPTPVTASDCTGSPLVLSLSWKQWVAGTHPDDFPSGTGTSFRADYVFAPDSSNNARCMITRSLYQKRPTDPSFVQQGSTLELIHDLVGSASLSQANLTASTVAAAGSNCTTPATSVTVSLLQYHTSGTKTDSAIPYTYFGCVNARTHGPSEIS